MNPTWWAPALTLSERCQLSGGVSDPQTAQMWRDQWKDSLGFGGSASEASDRLNRIAPASVLDHALGLDLDTVRIETPQWAGRLNTFYQEQQWPAREDIVGILTDVPGVPEEAVFAGLGALVVVAPILIDARDRLEAGIEKALLVGSGTDVASTWRKMLWPTLLGRVAGVVARTMVLEVNADRVSGLLSGDTPEERHRCFVESLLAGPRSLDVVREYPVMFRHALNVTDQTVNFLIELATRLTQDRPLIASTWGLSADVAVAGFSLDAGDTHRNGKAVALIRFADEAETVLVYKPRPMAVDGAFEHMLTWFSQGLSATGDVDLRIPGSIDRGDYGWSEFVRPQPCADSEGVQRFYRRQGLLLSMLHVLGGSDFHFENCIATGEYPMLIDLETLFHQLQVTERPDSLSDGDFEVFLELNRSVMQIGLLPIPLWGTEDRPGVDLSGLGGEPGQVIPQPHGVLKDGGTDQARIERVDSHDLPGQLNRPTLDGEPVRTEDFIEDIVSGFRAGHEFFAGHTSELTRHLQAFTKVELRYIVRHTATYARLLTESSHPDLNRDALARDCFLDGLWAAARNDKTLTPIVEAERIDLNSGNIPLFTFRPESQSLIPYADSSIDEFFPRTGLASLIERARNLSLEDRDFQAWVIRSSIASRGKDIPATATPTRPIITAEERNDRIKTVAVEFAEELIRTARGHQNPTWPTLAPSPGGQWNIGPADEGLYRGTCGVAIFLAAAGQTYDRTEYTVMAQTIVRGALRKLKTSLDAATTERHELHRRLGAFDGIGGILYAAARTKTTTEDELRKLALRSLQDPATDQGPPTDVIAGLAGLIAVTESLKLLTPEETAPYRENLKELIPTDDAAAFLHDMGSGYGHGSPGFLAAIDPHHPELTRLEWESTEQITSWCKGGLGRFAAYIKAFPSAGPEQQITLIHAATTIVEALPEDPEKYADDSLCHGTAAALDLLIEAEAVGLLTPAQTHLKSQLTEWILSRAEGKTLRSLTPHAIHTPGLLDGQSGAFLALLRTVSPAAGTSVLAHH